MPSKMKVPDIKAPHQPGYRSDMEKCGLFIDMGILKGTERYMDFAKAVEFRAEGRKGKQLLGSGPKTKAGLRDCYFDKVERRIFEGDGLTDPVRARHQAQMASRLKDIAKRWVPAKGRTSICGLGNTYGTFAGRVSHFSAVNRDRPEKEPYYPCFVAVGPKSGSYGWNGYTFSKFPEHGADPYDGDLVNKDYVDENIDAENTRRRNRRAYVTAGKPKRFFTDNPYYVENPLTEPEGKPSNIKAAFDNGAPYRPPGRLKPMKDMKYWGTFNKLDDLGGNYYQAGLYPFRPRFYGKQELPHPYVPPAGPKSVLVVPVTQANMPRQMDIRKTDNQEIVYAANANKPVAFPKREKVEARLAKKNIHISPKLYERPDPIVYTPPGHVTLAPPNKPWFA